MREAKAAAARGIEERRSGETGHVATERFPAHQKISMMHRWSSAPRRAAVGRRAMVGGRGQNLIPHCSQAVGGVLIVLENELNVGKVSSCAADL